MIKKRFPEKLKGQKGSITLFVLISIIFFLIVLISIYIGSGNKERTQISEIEAIQEEYNVSPEELQEEYNDIVYPENGEYRITYILNGGVVTGNPDTYTKEDDDIILNNPTQKGYTFTGWTGTDLTSLTMKVTIPSGSTGSRRYEANWKANKYTITFDGNGATSGDMTNVVMEYDKKEKLPENKYQKTGYTFVGWSTDKNSSEVKYKDGDEVSNLTDIDGEQVKLYAVWSINSYSLTIDPNGGEYKESKDKYIQTGEYNSTIEIGEAIWTDNDKVTFDGNGGSSPEPLEVGKTFIGWKLGGGVRFFRRNQIHLRRL